MCRTVRQRTRPEWRQSMNWALVAVASLVFPAIMLALLYLVYASRGE